MPNFMPNFMRNLRFTVQPPNSSETTAETTANPSELLAQFNISSESPIACMTLPMLLGLVGGKAIAEGLQSLGQASEEIFRGDRLPVLHFPVAPIADPQDPIADPQE